MRLVVTHLNFTMIVKLHHYTDHTMVFVMDTTTKEFTSFELDTDATISDLRTFAHFQLQESVFGDNFISINVASTLYRGEYN